MAEYIERDALRQAVLESQHDNSHPRGWAHIAHDCEHAHFVAMIDLFPAADVAPVVHGRWIHDGCRIEGGIDWCHCSECGKSDNFCARTNYYPKCGAKMDGGE